MFRAHVLIVRMSKLYYTVSGIIKPIGGRPMSEKYGKVRNKDLQNYENLPYVFRDI